MTIPKAAEAFCLAGAPCGCQPYGGGHINETYKISTDTGVVYILQRINHHVFLDPVALMENAAGVTAHIRARGGNAIGFLADKAGNACHRDAEGNYWRAYHFVPGFCLDAPRGLEDLYQSGRAFGDFQQQLLDYPAQTLHETIPNFHNTPVRFQQLRAALDADAAGRAESCREELEQSFRMEEMASRLQKQLDRGELPLRVTHNDTKLGNVLLDEKTGEPLCVLDLDTVMPGLAAYDFGDAIRSAAGTEAEDTQEPEKMVLDLERYRAFARGYLETARSLTDAERRSLPLGAFTMTLECGIRFLADHLNGDTYFRIHRPNHNLDRARAQLALACSILRHLPDLEALS